MPCVKLVLLAQKAKHNSQKTKLGLYKHSTPQDFKFILLDLVKNLVKLFFKKFILKLVTHGW